MNILIKNLSEMEIAFVRRTGSYFEPQEHWGKLIDWAISNGLYPPQQSFIGISLDNPDKIESKDCRHDACPIPALPPVMSIVFPEGSI